LGFFNALTQKIRAIPFVQMQGSLIEKWVAVS